jgi:hypothetical protein
LPLGAINWNKIEHRLFSFIIINWRGKGSAVIARSSTSSPPLQPTSVRDCAQR